MRWYLPTPFSLHTRRMMCLADGTRLPIEEVKASVAPTEKIEIRKRKAPKVKEGARPKAR